MVNHNEDAVQSRNDEKAKARIKSIVRTEPLYQAFEFSRFRD